MATTGLTRNDSSYISLPRGRRLHKAWIMMIACASLSAGTVGVIFGPAGVFFIPLCNELGFARAQISSWQQAYMLSSIVAIPIAGSILEKYNIRFVVSICGGACALAAALMGTYTELWQFVASGLVYGIFGAAVIALPRVITIANWFDKRTGIAMGVAMALASIASMFFAPFFTYLISLIGWRATYFVQGAVVACMILPFSLFVLRIRPSDIGALPYGYSIHDRGESEKGSKEEVSERLAGNAGVPVRKAVPTVTFACMLLFAGIVAAISSGFDAHIPTVSISMGHDAMFGAFLVSALQLGSFVDKIGMGWINDKIGVQRTIYIEFVIVIVGMLGLAFSSNQVVMVICAFLFGVQDSFTSISVPLLLRKYFGRKDYSRLYSYSRVASNVVSAFAVTLVGYSFDATGSYSAAFVIASLFAVLAFIAVTIARVASKKLVWEYDSEESRPA